MGDNQVGNQRIDKDRVGQSISPSLPLVYRGLVQWLGCRPVSQQLVSAWVRIPQLTAFTALLWSDTG